MGYTFGASCKIGSFPGSLLGPQSSCRTKRNRTNSLNNMTKSSSYCSVVKFP